MRRRNAARTGVGVAATAGLIAVCVWSQPDGDAPADAAPSTRVSTARVERGPLASAVSQSGTLAYGGTADGSARPVFNRMRGSYTALPDAGDAIRCGDVIYRVDQRPVVLLCGPVPMYRPLRQGRSGADVRQLNRGLHTLGYDRAADVTVHATDRSFTWRTSQAVMALQRRLGVAATGRLGRADAVVLPESARVAKVVAQPGGPARSDAPVLQVTSNRLRVQVNLDPSQQRAVKVGDAARIMLLGRAPLHGKVAHFGRVASAADGEPPTSATVPTFISLDDPSKARGLDRAPVEVEITTDGARDVLSVPVTAIVGKAGGGFAVEAVRTGGRRELVGVKLGLFDSTAGRVQVDGPLQAGDAVVVPAP